MLFLQGSLGILVAFAIILFRRQLYQFTGDIDFAEKYLFGTMNFFVICALILIIISTMWMFGTFQSLTQEIAGPYF